jgi:4-hydroxybenzoate polyprenyltransferase
VGVNPRTLLALGRVSNLPTVWTNVLLGYAVALTASGAHLHADHWAALAICLLSGTLLYEAGMFLNDAYDAEIDRRERPERPIPSGRIERRVVFWIGFVLLGLGVVAPLATTALGWLVGWGASACAAFTAASVWAYDRVHKGVAWSPLLMGGCRSGLYGMAAFAATEHPASSLAVRALALLSYVVGLTHVARFETSSRVQKSWVLASLLAPTLAALWIGSASWALLAVALVLHLSWTAVCLRWARAKAPGSIGRAVVSLIAGISLVDAVFAAGAGLDGVLLVAYCGFGLTLFLQRWVRGT